MTLSKIGVEVKSSPGSQGVQGPEGPQGEQGAQGPAGPTGHIDLSKLKGYYQPAVAYSTGDVVEYWPRKAYYRNGSFQELYGGVFVAKNATTGNAPIADNGAPNANWQELYNNVRFPLDAEEDVVLVATGQSINMKFCTREIIIPSSLSGLPSFTIILPSDTGFREHYKEPSFFTIHNGTNKYITLKNVQGNTITGWKSTSSSLAMDGSAVNLDTIDDGVWKVLKLGNPHYNKLFVNKIS